MIMNNAVNAKVLTVGIAGGSCGGKTVLTDNIRKNFSGGICVLHQDNYYKHRADLSFEERAGLNYDCPAAFDTELLIRHIEALSEGRGVMTPLYDFGAHLRKTETAEAAPAPVVIAEGILVLADERLRELLDVKIFVDSDADERLARRILRDASERGRDAESVIKQYLTTVKPMHELYVEPCKMFADIIVNGGRNPAAIGFLANVIGRYRPQTLPFAQ